MSIGDSPEQDVELVPDETTRQWILYTPGERPLLVPPGCVRVNHCEEGDVQGAGGQLPCGHLRFTGRQM